MSKLEDLEKLWSNDCKVDKSELDNEALRIPELHSKYYKLYIREKISLRSYEEDSKKLYKDKWEYYNGKLSQEELKEKGLEQFPLKILRQDIEVYIQADKDIIENNLKLAIQKEKVDFLENIIKNINSRGFYIKSAIDFLRWTQGTI